MESDVYVLANSRDAKTAKLFLDEFLPERGLILPSQNINCHNGQYDFEFQCRTETELLGLMETNINLVYLFSAYPKKKQEIIRNAWIRYLQDGGMICGLNINQNDTLENIFLNEIKKLLGSDLGMVSYHVAPPLSKAEFLMFK